MLLITSKHISFHGYRRKIRRKDDSALSSAIANQESLSGLETEMRKLEGVVKEIVDEMEYLKKREERFQSTNSTSSVLIMVLSDTYFGGS